MVPWGALKFRLELTPFEKYRKYYNLRRNPVCDAVLFRIHSLQISGNISAFHDNGTNEVPDFAEESVMEQLLNCWKYNCIFIHATKCDARRKHIF